MLIGEERLRRLVDEGMIRPRDLAHVTPNGVDLHLGERGAILSGGGGRLDPAGEAGEFVEVRPTGGKFIIPARSFFLFETAEELRVPRGVVGLIGLRSTAMRWGLVGPMTVIDSGFSGKITYGVWWPADRELILRPMTRILHVVFFESEGAGTYAGGYAVAGLALPKRLAPDPLVDLTAQRVIPEPGKM